MRGNRLKEISERFEPVERLFGETGAMGIWKRRVDNPPPTTSWVLADLWGLAESWALPNRGDAQYFVLMMIREVRTQLCTPLLPYQNL